MYSDLCLILGISINEFLAGEDIAQENIERKSEENIIGVATDSKHKQRRLKAVICALLIISILAVSVIGAALYRANKPMNFIAPVSEDKAIVSSIIAIVLGYLGSALGYEIKSFENFCRKFGLRVHVVYLLVVVDLMPRRTGGRWWPW